MTWAGGIRKRERVVIISIPPTKHPNININLAPAELWHNDTGAAKKERTLLNQASNRLQCGEVRIHLHLVSSLGW